MLVEEKTKELIKAIENSKEYKNYVISKKNLAFSPKESESLERYRELLLENQMEQFLEGKQSSKRVQKIEELYADISLSEGVNDFLIAEYELKEMLGSVYRGLTKIIENADQIKTDTEFM